MAREPSARRAFLLHGLDDRGTLVGVDEVASGRTALSCPYCETRLLAKKGRVLAAHFAHDGETCRESAERQAARIPFYDDFETLEPLGRADLKLCRSLRGQTINHTSLRGWRRASLRRLVDAGLIEEVPRGQRWVDGIGSHRHTAWGEAVAAATRHRLTLAAMAEVQARAALAKLDALEARAADRASPLSSVDLRLYRASLARLLSLDLYLLEARADGRVLHKIGVTARSIDDRLPEIRTDLSAHFEQVEVDVHGVWPQRGSLELYFKQRFAPRRATLGSHTEYFEFDTRPEGGRLYRVPFKMLAELDTTPVPQRLADLLHPPETPDPTPSRASAAAERTKALPSP
ncbi:MAG: GIY-YIG nuclease family protein [Deltaproteobacteria bacterium]|nr:GIY-YIG nuclease family protein [Deltaproteobacteria bacterium]